MRTRVVLACDCVCRSCGQLFSILLTDYPDNLDIDVECPFDNKQSGMIINTSEPEEPYYETDN